MLKTVFKRLVKAQILAVIFCKLQIHTRCSEMLDAGKDVKQQELSSFASRMKNDASTLDLTCVLLTNLNLPYKSD